MKEFDYNINLDRMTKEDVLSIAISLLYSLRNTPKYSILSELPYLTDYESLINLIKYYGGMTIRIPTIDEINKLFKLLLLYQYYKVEHFNWETALIKAGYSLDDTNSARAQLVELQKILMSQEIGGRTYE